LSKIIIGIHGLGNKPPDKLLKKWWKKSIREGLKAYGYSHYIFKFEMVYWADILHPDPLDPKSNDKSHPLFIQNPYTAATDYNPKPQNKIKQKLLDYLEKQMDKLFLNEDMSINFSSVTDAIIHKYFQDLEIYFTGQSVDTDKGKALAKDIIRQRLTRALVKNRNNEIFIIAHSMGTIITYDVLVQRNLGVKIDTLVTIGSPLGLPIVKSKILEEIPGGRKQHAKLYTPENVKRHWFNFSDLDDKVAVNYNLADDYCKNTSNVGPIDKVVFNNYEYENARNPHKSYGYLRTPEMAEVVSEFLSRDRNRLVQWLNTRLNKLAQKLFLNININDQ